MAQVDKVSKKNQVFFLIVGWITALVVLIPLYIVVVNAMKDRVQIFDNVFGLPARFTLEYIGNAIEKMKFFRAFFNSVIISISAIGAIVIVSSMAAWVLVRTKGKLSQYLLFLFVIPMILPFQSLMIPLLSYFSLWEIDAIEWSFLDSRIGLVFIYIGMGSSLPIFLYHGFIKSIPLSLEEAAIIDGSTPWRLFWRVIFPNLKGITFTVAILRLIWIWNDFLLPSLILTESRLYTIPIAARAFQGVYRTDYNLVMAALLLAITPVVVFYLLAQKHIIKGIMAGAIK